VRSASSVGCAENTGELCNKQKSMISDTKIENKGPTVRFGKKLVDGRVDFIILLEQAIWYVGWVNQDLLGKSTGYYKL